MLEHAYLTKLVFWVIYIYLIYISCTIFVKILYCTVYDGADYLVMQAFSIVAISMNIKYDSVCILYIFVLNITGILSALTEYATGVILRKVCWPLTFWSKFSTITVNLIQQLIWILTVRKQLLSHDGLRLNNLPSWDGHLFSKYLFPFLLVLN